MRELGPAVTGELTALETAARRVLTAPNTLPSSTS
jgi:hypothetical protein